MSSMHFTCDSCGREVFGCTFVNGMKFCAKCYQETFGETDKDRKIADLEAKLEEKEKEIITLNCVISEIHNDIKELHEFKVGEDEYDLTDSDARFSLQCDLLNNEQDKISFAIAKLEKVKEFNTKQVFISKTLDNFIDNQIKQLKGEKE